MAAPGRRIWPIMAEAFCQSKYDVYFFIYFLFIYFFVFVLSNTVTMCDGDLILTLFTFFSSRFC